MPRSPVAIPAALLLTLAAPQGCTNGAVDPSTEGTSTGDRTSTTGDPTGLDTGAPTTGEPTAPALAFEVTLHPQQPMVVDVHVTLDQPATVTLAHLADDGVIVARTAGEPQALSQTFRVRGLAPDTGHDLALTATGAANLVTEDVVTFTTPPALPGFLPGFEVTGSDAAEPLWRLLDLTDYPATAFAGLFAVDRAGTTRWYLGAPSQIPGPEAVWAAARLRDDGTLLYLADAAAWIRDELGDVVWTLSAADLGLPTLHHDILELDSGNFLALAMVFRDVDDPDLGVIHTVGDLLVEFTPAGEIVWQWDSFDHLDPLRRRETFEWIVINPETGEEAYDWTHANGIVHDPNDDSVLLSLRHQDWILKIDRATGDIVWRLGPEGDFTLIGDDTWFYHPHSPYPMPDGSMLLYDNAVGNPDLPPEQEFSRAVRYALDEDAMTATLIWQDDAEPFSAPIAGDVDPLPGGHLLVLDSSILTGPVLRARLRELDPDASPMMVWSLTTPIGQFAYRATAHARLPGMPQ